MWDPSLTTESDQQRWIQQGIDIRPDPLKKNVGFCGAELDAWMDDDTTTNNEKYISKTVASDNLSSSSSLHVPESSGPVTTEEATDIISIQSSPSHRIVLEQFANSHLPWGFVQEHGGPCGVLATVQAELLRIFGQCYYTPY